LIRLTRLADYGVLLMAHLAGAGAGAHNARELAARTGLPLPVVSKVLKTLAREGLLLSQRGPRGGYELARPAAAIPVAEIVAALEGPIGLTECTAHPGVCAQESTCHTRDPWQRINAVIRDALSRISLAELATPSAPGAIVPLESLGVDTRS
jgi:FeS assembly SUF system regulator